MANEYNSFTSFHGIGLSGESWAGDSSLAFWVKDKDAPNIWHVTGKELPPNVDDYNEIFDFYFRDTEQSNWNPKTDVIRCDKAISVNEQNPVYREIIRLALRANQFGTWGDGILPTRVAIGNFIGSLDELIVTGHATQTYHTIVGNPRISLVHFWFSNREYIFDNRLGKSQKRIRSWAVGSKPTDQLGIRRSLRVPL